MIEDMAGAAACPDVSKRARWRGGVTVLTLGGRRELLVVRDPLRRLASAFAEVAVWSGSSWSVLRSAADDARTHRRA